MDDLRVVVADNPGPMTLDGTRSYVLGTSEVVLIDPGPDDAGHLAALEAAVADRPVVRVLLTHAHADHAGLARRASKRFGAPVGGSPDTLRRLGLPLSGAGRPLADGDRLTAGSLAVTALHTPGHSADHVCYLADPGRRLFTGDLVLGEGSSAILYPDGSVTACFASLARLAALRPGALYPGHGPPVEDAAARLGEYRRHRRERERQIETALEAGAKDVEEVLAAVYGDLPAGLVRAAEASIAAHLAALAAQGRDVPDFAAHGFSEPDVAHESG